MKDALFTRTLAIVAAVILSQSCQSFLDKEPQGAITEANLFKDPVNAVQAVNAVYDVASWDEGPKYGNGPYIGHMYEWMFGDVMSDDAEKGSQPSDFDAISDLKLWRADASNVPVGTLWSHNFTGIARANTVINNVEAGSIDAALKSRLKGEALFMRGYFYFYLVRTFGGVPLFEKPVQVADIGGVARASIADTYAFIEKDFRAAAALLPERDGYAAGDLGRATKGAANAYLARAIMYELGTVNAANHTWQDVYDLTDGIIKSNKYSMLPNYATIHQSEGANAAESIFEIQFITSPEGYGPIKTGTTNNVFQNNRKTFGYGFNNPTQNLMNEFEANDPRMAVTFIKTGDIVLGINNLVDNSENDTGYLSRKVAILRPQNPKAGDQNIRKFRYADVLLMKAEAAAKLGKDADALGLLNQIRQRARNSSKPKGSTMVGVSNDYAPANVPAGTLPDLVGLTGQPLLNAIWHERRVELAEESLRYWDLIRTGRYVAYLNSLRPAQLPAAVVARFQSHTVPGTINPLGVLPIPIIDAQTFKLPQNPGY